jgi:hypothetical protein
VLHVGSSIPEKGRGQASQYESFSFVDPDQVPANWHLHVEGDNLTVDVTQLADSMLVALRAWFEDVVEPRHEPDAATVERNLRNLVRVQPKTVHIPAGTIIIEHRSITTSST